MNKTGVLLAGLLVIWLVGDGVVGTAHADRLRGSAKPKTRSTAAGAPGAAGAAGP